MLASIKSVIWPFEFVFTTPYARGSSTFLTKIHPSESGGKSNFVSKIVSAKTMRMGPDNSSFAEYIACAVPLGDP